MSGKLLIFSAPSGAGKTTVVKHLLTKNFKLEFSISATNRPMRPNEVDGKDYHFLSTEEFQSRISKDDFLEWEEVYKGCFYGTLKSEVDRITEKGNNVIFDVDVVGGLNIKKFYEDKALAVFIQPPSVEELENRLRGRSTDSEEVIRNRVDKFIYELSYAKRFDTIIVNEDVYTSQGSNNIFNNSGFLSFVDCDPGGTDQIINNSGTVDMSGDFVNCGGDEAVNNLNGGTWNWSGTLHHSGLELFCNNEVNSFNYTNSGNQDILVLLDEFNAYTFSLITETDLFRFMKENAGMSGRDGLLAFMYFLELYLKHGRANDLEDYNRIKNDFEYLDAIKTLWENAENALIASAPYNRLGMYDKYRLKRIYQKESIVELLELFEGSGIYIDFQTLTIKTLFR